VSTWIDPPPVYPDDLESVLVQAETELVELDVAVETVRVELANFAHLHHHWLGPLYARLDELDALIAEVTVAQTWDPADIQHALRTRRQVDPAGIGKGDSPDGEAASSASHHRRVRISPPAQRLYRELARRAHPDLTQDTGEKQRRERFIVRVNQAYAQGDLAALRRLADEWAAAPDFAPPSDSPDRPAWLRTRLGWLRSRASELRAELAELADSPISRLWALDRGNPEELLRQLADQLFTQITERKEQLRQLLDD